MFGKILVRCLPIALLATAVYAQTGDDSKEAKELQKQAARIDREAGQSTGNQAVLNSLSKQLNVPAATLQAEQKSTKFGAGQLFIANSLAQASGKTFDQIAQEFKAGKGWGEIAKENNVKLGKVVSSAKRAGKQMREERTQAQAAKSNGAQRGASRQQGASPRGGMGSTPRGRGPRH